MKNAFSMAEASKKDMKFTLTITPAEESAPTIIRNIYECFRMLGDAILVSKGIDSKEHTMQISELINLKISTKRPLGVLDNLRRLRHDINYYGYRPNMTELKYIMDFSKDCYDDIFKKVVEEINRPPKQL